MKNKINKFGNTRDINHQQLKNMKHEHLALTKMSRIINQDRGQEGFMATLLIIPSGKRLHSYWKWTIEIVDLPKKSADFPVRYVSHYQRVMEQLGIPQPYDTMRRYQPKGWDVQMFMAFEWGDYVQRG